MPYKSQNLKIKNTEFDRRQKLTPEQKEEVIRLCDTEGLSQRQLAKRFGVSRRLITFILDPTKKERDLELRKERGGSKAYYDKDKWREQMKSHRRYKQELYLELKEKFEKKEQI
jgi:transposase